MSNLKFCVEVGGTFTDWVLVEGDRIAKTGKVVSTPEEPAQGVLAAAAAALDDLSGLGAIMHGSTVATNAVLERKGAATGLIVTEGFRDVLDIQRQTKTRLFDLFYRHPVPLVPRDAIVEVAERIGPDGSVWSPLVLDGLRERIGRLIEERGVASVAICLLHAYANGEHEDRVADALSAAFPDLLVTKSSEVLPRFREYERMSTTVISAYLKPRVDRYVARLEQAFEEAGFRGRLTIMQANGGTVPAREIRRHAARMVLSGPAAGVRGAIAAAAAVGIGNLLTIDMGGTSTDVCLVTDGQAGMTTEYKIGGLPLGIPMYDIVTVGAGGGSIASIDPGGALQVGPESAGAQPGPACYGKGGTSFTVTDANLLLGLIRPETFFGGRMPLSRDAAASAAAPIAAALGCRDVDAADGVVRVANAIMAQAMRIVSIERGHDPRDYTLVAYGGAGPLHALALAEELSIDRVLVPFDPGLMSAVGLTLADTRQDYLRTRILPLADLDASLVRGVLAELREQAVRDFATFGISEEDVRIEYGLDLRFEGQAYELPIPVDPSAPQGLDASTLTNAFRAVHLTRYGHVPASARVEIVNFRLLAHHPSSLTRLRNVRPGGGDVAPVRHELVVVDRTETSCPFHDRTTLPVGAEIVGPAVIEEPTATLFVRPGWRARVDDNLNLQLTRTEV